MAKIFLIGPEAGDPERNSYLASAAKQLILWHHPVQNPEEGYRIFYANEDLDHEPLKELAAASGFDPDNPEDRRRLIFSELLDSTVVYLMPGYEHDTLCQKAKALAEEVGIEVQHLEYHATTALPEK